MKQTLYIFTAYLVMLFTSCLNENISKDYSKKTILLSNIKKIEKSSVKKIIELTILNIYPASLKCGDSELCANLYIAKTNENQIIYIFEISKSVPDFALDTTGRVIPIIVPKEILEETYQEVTLFVPKDFQIPHDARYIFAQLGVLDES